MSRRILVAAALLFAGCGGGDGDARVTVYAAASLTEVFEELAPGARFNFAGSDELATQIREGARADVFAAASPRHPRELHEEGLVGAPRVFARNRLVIVVPAQNPARIASLDDLARRGVKLVVGAEGVPIGDYTREVLRTAGRDDVLARAVSQEEDVKGVIGKVRLGEADAGLAYVTDARAAGAAVRAIELPRPIQADVRYTVAIARSAERREEAEELVELLLSPRGQRVLRRAGFAPP